MNIAIVGSGLVGRVLALNLLKGGHTLTLFDKDSREGGSPFGRFTVLEFVLPLLPNLKPEKSIIFGGWGLSSMELWETL